MRLLDYPYKKREKKNKNVNNKQWKQRCLINQLENPLPYTPIIILYNIRRAKWPVSGGLDPHFSHFLSDICQPISDLAQPAKLLPDAQPIASQLECYRCVTLHCTPKMQWLQFRPPVLPLVGYCSVMSESSELVMVTSVTQNQLMTAPPLHN